MGPPPVDSDQPIRRQRTLAYPIQVWYLLAVFIFLVAVLQLASRLHSKYARRRRDDSTVSESNTSVPSSSLRRFPLAIVNTYRIVALRWTVQINIGTSWTLNVAEVFLMSAYIAAIFTWTFINTTNLEGKKFDSKYWCNRAGPIAASQFPLITALGSKNNIIALLTGISYEKLNSLHRMASRIVFVLLSTHAAGQLALNGVPPEAWKMTFLPMGVLALSSLFLLILVSLRPVRAKAYNWFFWAHFLLVLTFLLGAYYHTREFRLQKYIWPSFVIWGFDRFIRLLRVLVFAFSQSSSQPLDSESSREDSGQSTRVMSELEFISSDIIRLTISRPGHFHWSPGQSAYLTIPEVAKFPPEAHPFTIATVDYEDESESNTTENENSKDKGPSKSELVFFINVRSGFTKRLAGLTSLNAKKMNMIVLVDGPYGSPPDLRVYDTCVLIAGGTGVSYTLPLFLNLVEEVRKGKSNCRKLVFILTVRDIQHVTLIYRAVKNALRKAPSILSIDIRVHITSNSVVSLEDESTAPAEEYETSSFGHRDPEKAEQSDKPPSSFDSMLDHRAVMLNSGRPNISGVLKEEADATRGGRMAVTVCGSDSMVHSVRSALGMSVSGPAAVMRGGASVSLFVEGFGYA